jgi:hypothetical protein
MHCYSSASTSGMDAFTISTGVAGFLSLALEISKILKAYVDGVQSAPKEARNLLVEVTALCHALEQLVQFLRKDYNGNFAETSALVVATEAWKDQITTLSKRSRRLKCVAKGVRSCSSWSS